MQLFRAQGADHVALGEAGGMTTGFSGRPTLFRNNDAISPRPLQPVQLMREAALLCFSDSHSHSLVYILTTKEWKELLRWLDVSGLALYFLDRMTETGRLDCLPDPIRERLEHSLEENRHRTAGFLQESVRLQREFQSTKLSYAVMKGISLHPLSVPRPELRHQFDLDFLIADRDAPAARRILERHGYTLFAISGRSWEFKKGQTPHVRTKDLYRDLPYRGVELHLETSSASGPARLDRAASREIGGISMPVLSPVDLFLGQAIHASKDISSPFFRASHLLEFYRHVLARRDDTCFWEEVRLRGQEDKQAQLAIGIDTYLATSVWGAFAPEVLTSWTLEQLPTPIQLWLDLYGRAAIVQVPPGSKRYLRLRQELENAGAAPALSSKSSLLSFGLPRAVIRATPGESLLTKVARYRVQIRFLGSRLRFHSVEGLRFVIESRRWRRLRKNLR